MGTWQHAPAHHFTGSDTFFVTGGTYLKKHYYRTADALDELRTILFATAKKHECWLQAWALLSNHYHLVVKSERGESVREMLSRFHTEAADIRNERDNTPGRQVWFQFWDKALTFQGSWLARLRYTNENAVHHRLVRVASAYRWCSAAWFETNAPRKFVEVVRSVKIDAIKVYDDFD